MYNIYLPAGWVKFLLPAQAKEIIAASIVSAVSAKNFRFNYLTIWRDASCVSCHSCIFALF
jgi:hypothetical protein